MEKKAFVFLAEGFEEVEAITPVDLLRRAGVEVTTVGVGGQTVTGAHGIPVVADVPAEGFVLPKDAALVVLPGGMPGTVNLGKSPVVKSALHAAAGQGAVIAAICAAPTVLWQEGLLQGKRFTAFPGKLENATGAAVETDGNLVTARSAGVALAFAHALIKALLGGRAADETLAQTHP